MVSPKPGAAIEAFNPHDEFSGALGRGEPPAYIDLFDLVSRHTDPGRPIVDSFTAPPDPARFLAVGDAAPAIARWCAQHGALGIALHRARTVSIPNGPTWHKNGAYWRWGGQSPTGGAGVEMCDLRGEYSWQDAAEWTKYFPGLEDEDWRIIDFHDTAFWWSYVESAHEFLLYAATLRWAANALVQPAANPPQDGPARAFEAVARGIIERWTADTSIVIARRGGKYGQRWVAPTMLGWLSLQVLHDIVLGKARFEQCHYEHCGNTFRKTGDKQHCCDSHRKMQWRLEADRDLHGRQARVAAFVAEHRGDGPWGPLMKAWNAAATNSGDRYKRVADFMSDFKAGEKRARRKPRAKP